MDKNNKKEIMENMKKRLSAYKEAVSKAAGKNKEG